MDRLPAGYRAGRRLLYVVSVPVPAAGSDFTFTVPGGRFWRPLLLRAQLTASVAVANRVPALVVSVDGSPVATLPVNANVVASGVARVTWGVDLQPTSIAGAANGQFLTVPLPRLLLPPGATLAAATDAIGVADQWTAPALYVEEIFTDSAGDEVESARELAALIAGELAGV